MRQLAGSIHQRGGCKGVVYNPKGPRTQIDWGYIGAIWIMETKMETIILQGL